MRFHVEHLGHRTHTLTHITALYASPAVTA